VFIVETVGGLEDDGREEIEEEEFGGKLWEYEMIVVEAGLINGTFVSEEEIQKATKEDTQDDEEAGLRNLGGNDMSSMKAEFCQARKYYEAHHRQIVLYLLPSPSNQMDLKMFVIIMVTLLRFSFCEIHYF